MRNIEPTMIDWLNLKLKNHGAAQLAMKEKNPRALYGYANDVCVGIREQGGNNKGPMVRLMQETIGIAQGEAWCMSAQQTLIAYAEEITGIESKIYPSEHCLTVWNKSPKNLRVRKIPATNALIIWQNGNTVAGHTGCMREWNNTWMLTCEGNTTGGVSPIGEVVRDGGGFYMCKRNVKGTGKLKVIGFLKPW